MEQDLKKKIEAVLFSIGRRISIDELKKLVHIENSEIIAQLLNELKDTYEKNDSSLRLIQDSEFWKMSVKEEYGEIMQDLVTETELSKSVMETLAVIAWKHPALQADVVRLRTNKAYDDIAELEEMGFIARSKYGRTRKISLTDKFFNYFDLPEHKQVLKSLVPEEVREKVDDTEQAIDAGEKAIEEEKVKKELEKQKQESLKEMDDSQKEIHQAIESIKGEKE
jgi:segregation and condensation protein B